MVFDKSGKEVVKIEIAVESFPLDELYGGDAYIVKKIQGKVLIAVVDGLGHGEMASSAAELAIKTIKGIDSFSLADILEKTHRALGNSVGVVIGLALIDRDHQTITFSGVGNIVIRLIGNKETLMLLPKGILGYNFEKKMLKEIFLDPGDILVMHTDGIRNIYETSRFVLEKPKKIACTLVCHYRVPNDDALVLVAADLLTE